MDTDAAVLYFLFSLAKVAKNSRTKTKPRFIWLESAVVALLNLIIKLFALRFIFYGAITKAFYETMRTQGFNVMGRNFSKCMLMLHHIAYEI